MNDIFAKDLNGEMVSPNDTGYEELIADVFATMKTATEMNTGYQTPEEVHEYMGRILGKPLDRSRQRGNERCAGHEHRSR